MSLIPRVSNHSDAVARASVWPLHFADKVLSRWDLIFLPLTGYSINKEKARRAVSLPLPPHRFAFFPATSRVETIS